jgi:hypothetical protein
MRHLFLALAIAGCGIHNKVAPDGSTTDATDDAPAGSAGELTIALTDQPAALGRAATVSFSFATSIPAATECSVDSAAYAACTSPVMASLRDGMHTFDVRATAADQHAAIPTYSFTVDTTPPSLAITGQPAMQSPVATAQFHFTSGDSTTVTCQLDAAAAAPCTSPVSYSGIADGMHKFTLAGSDGAGNTSSRSYAWTIDTSAPVLAITTEPPNPSTSATAQFEFTIGTSTAVTCALDSAAAAACTSPRPYTGLADGSHTFTLAGTNAAGTTTTRTYTWSVDTTPPVLAITQPPPAATNKTSVSIAFTVGDAASWTCQLDGGNPQACTSPFSATGLTDGSHSFTLRGSDAAGNTATQAATWTVDTVPPTVTILSHPGPSSHSVSISFTVSEGSPACSIDLQPSTGCSSPATYTLADGGHSFVVSATDAAGNYNSDAYSWIIDTTKPAVSLTTTCSGYQYSASWNVSDANAITAGTCTYTYGSNVMTWDCLNVSSASGSILGGGTLRISYTDEYGNIGSASKTWTDLSCE